MCTDNHVGYFAMKVRTHAFRKAHENIDTTLKEAEVVLTKFDVSRQVSGLPLQNADHPSFISTTLSLVGYSNFGISCYCLGTHRLTARMD